MCLKSNQRLQNLDDKALTRGADSDLFLWREDFPPHPSVLPARHVLRPAPRRGLRNSRQRSRRQQDYDKLADSVSGRGP